MESDKIAERLGKQGFEKIAMLADNLPVIKEGQQVEVSTLFDGEMTMHIGLETVNIRT